MDIVSDPSRIGLRSRSERDHLGLGEPPGLEINHKSFLDLTYYRRSASS